MEPDVDVVLRTSLPNNTWSRKQFKKIKLKIERDIVKKGIKYLVIGRTAQKVKLQLTSNIRDIFQNWLDSAGKVTLRFKNPPVDCLVQVSSATARSKAFLRDTVQQIKFSARGKDVTPQQKFEIVNKDDEKWKYIGRQYQLPKDKLFLTVLDLTGRELTSLPAQVGDLNLIELNLTKNYFGRETYFWSWLYGNIRNTLNFLILDDNQLVKVPAEVASCKALFTLSLSNNDIKWIPPLLFSPWRSTLRELRLTNNRNLRALPQPSRILEKLDIVGCTALSEPRPLLTKFEAPWPGIQLKHVAAQAVLQGRVFYGLHNLPREMIAYLDSSCHCDRCSRLVPAPKFYTFVPEGSKALQTVASGRNGIVYSQYFICACCSNRLRRWRGAALI